MHKRTLPIIIGNWKTTPATFKEASKFVRELDKKYTSIRAKVRRLPKKGYYLAVPEVFIPGLRDLDTAGWIGAQNVSGVALGEVTGVSIPSMLASAGAEFTLIGHSEVRARGESVEDRSHKVALSLQNKLLTVLCIGEEKRDSGGKYLAHLEKDVQNSLALVSKGLFENLIIAYEPVWAIGGTTPATPQECFEVVIALRRALAALVGIEHAKKVCVLYGGTVDEHNAGNFLEEGGVDGLLVGRASQDVASFSKIISSCYGI